MEQITIQIHGASQIGGNIRGDLRRRIFRSIGREFWLTSRETFGVGGTNRQPWPPLSPKYQKQLRSKSFGASLLPTLLRSGTLLNSIRFWSDGNQAVVFTKCPYAAVHQFGRAPIPARPFLQLEFKGIGSGGWGLTPYAEAKIGQAIAREIGQI